MTKNEHNEIMRELGKLSQKVSGLETRVETGFKDINSHLDKLNSKVSDHRGRINELETSDAVSDRVDSIREKRFNRSQSYKDWAIKGVLSFIAMLAAAVIIANLPEIGDMISFL